MITHIKGRLVEKNPTDVVIECNGVGYLLHISLHTFSLLPESELLQLYTHFQVKEDGHTLFGFMEKSERQIFRLLLSVSGIGANTARTMLSSLEPDCIKEAIAIGDVATIQSVKGIGAKTAQRVILDLKDKILKVFNANEVSAVPLNTNKDGSLAALETLGFQRKQAEKVVDSVLKENHTLGIEAIIKEYLKKL